MSHGPEHEIEHAEHAAHASHDEFNRRVTMSIAIVAAGLACVSMLGHRAHNETLGLQGEALSLETEASIMSTKAANKWAYYQSKNTKHFQSKIVVDSLAIVPIRSDREKEAKEIEAGYQKIITDLRGDKDKRSTTPGHGESAESQTSPGRLAQEKELAEELEKQRDDLIVEAKKMIKKSHVEHAKAARFDFGELGLQFGVVLCSLAILTRGRRFWFVGIISAAVGAGFALSGQLGLFLGEPH